MEHWEVTEMHEMLLGLKVELETMVMVIIMTFLFDILFSNQQSAIQSSTVEW